MNPEPPTPDLPARLTHVSPSGEARMVDVGAKSVTQRMATARAVLHARPETVTAIRENAMKKGDVAAVARVAGIMASKRTSELIPLCHPISLTSIEVAVELGGERDIVITATAQTAGRTGVEMEALTAASVAALTIYDMCKAVDRGMMVTEIALLDKAGGKSGSWRRPDLQGGNRKGVRREPSSR